MRRTFRTAKRASVCTLALWLLAGCATEPRLLLPTSPEGLACIAVCDAARSRCVSFETASTELAVSACDNSQQVQTCVDRAVDDRTVLACEAKLSTGHCPGTAPSLGPCHEDRLMCALQCGAKMLDP
jgi:hypothetical protein